MSDINKLVKVYFTEQEQVKEKIYGRNVLDFAGKVLPTVGTLGLAGVLAYKYPQIAHTIGSEFGKGAASSVAQQSQEIGKGLGSGVSQSAEETGKRLASGIKNKIPGVT